MPALLVTLLLAAGALVALFGPPRAVLVVLVTTWLLVPGGARIPGAEGGQLFLHRIVLAAVLVGLVRTVVLRRLPPDVFAVRGVHLAFLGYLFVALVGGVVLAQPDVAATLNRNAFLDLVEQAAWFVAALALFRAVGARRSAGVVVGVAGVMAAVGVIEHVFSWSYSRWFARHLSDPSGLLSLGLTTRGPHERIRVGAAFALEYGWVAAMLIPLAVACAVVARPRHRLVAWAIPAALLFSLVATWSRSAYAGLGIGVVVLALGVVLDRPHRALPLGLVGLLLTGILLQGPLREALELGVTGGEQDVRFERLPAILGLVADHPVTGLGLGGLLSRRIDVIDISWVTTYSTIGVLGVIALAVLLLSASHAASRFVLSAPSPTRVLAAGAGAAVVVAPLTFASYDAGTLRMSTETVWTLAALALVANEELGVLARPPQRRAHLVPPLTATLGVLGLAGGILLALAVPQQPTVDAVFTTVSPRVSALTPSDQQYTIKVLSQTACTIVDAMDTGASVHCLDLDQVAGGVGTLRIEAHDATAAGRAFEVIRDRLLDVFPGATVNLVDTGRGRPTWAATAPLWMAAVGLALGTAAPDRLVRTPPGRPVKPPGARHVRAGTGPGPTRPGSPPPRPSG